MCDKALEDKCGSSLLFRRGFQEFSLLCYLVQSQEILQTSSASLSELLHKSDVQMPKNSTKNQKIRRLLSLQAVKQACGEARLLRLLAKLDEQDEKRKRKQESKDEELQQPEAWVPKGLVEGFALLFVAGLNLQLPRATSTGRSSTMILLRRPAESSCPDWMRKRSRRRRDDK